MKKNKKQKTTQKKVSTKNLPSYNWIMLPGFNVAEDVGILPDRTHFIKASLLEQLAPQVVEIRAAERGFMPITMKLGTINNQKVWVWNRDPSIMDQYK